MGHREPHPAHMGKHAGAQKRGVVASCQLHDRSAGAAKCFKAGNSEPVTEVSVSNCRACSTEPFPSASLIKSEQHLLPAKTYFWQQHMHLIAAALPFKQGEKFFLQSMKIKAMFVSVGMNTELQRGRKDEKEIKSLFPLLKQTKVNSQDTHLEYYFSCQGPQYIWHLNPRRELVYKSINIRKISILCDLLHCVHPMRDRSKDIVL